MQELCHMDLLKDVNLHPCQMWWARVGAAASWHSNPGCADCVTDDGMLEGDQCAEKHGSGHCC